MAKTKIPWTQESWNPMSGCSHASTGCINCYAERMAKRLQAMGQPDYVDGFRVTCHPQRLAIPSRWRKPRLVFVNSMGDLFHDEVPTEFIVDVFAAMSAAPLHTFQVLTKRHDRLVELAGKLRWPGNVWMGVSVENQACVGRIDALRQVPAALRFVSFEPLIGPVGREVDLSGIGWAIVGGETGPGYRPMDPDWARNLRDACADQEVPFYLKQWAGGRSEPVLDGRMHREMPLGVAEQERDATDAVKDDAESHRDGELDD